MIEVCRADDFDFFLPFIEAGKLTVVQMYEAAERYRLGKTKSGRPMFWMINDKMEPLDAHIANSTWLSTLLKAREPELLECWRVKHCLFGQHLLSTSSTSVCVVETEKTAVVCSELFPESLWMAYPVDTCVESSGGLPFQVGVVAVRGKRSYERVAEEVHAGVCIICIGGQ